MRTDPKKLRQKKAYQRRGVWKTPKHYGICLDSLHLVPPGNLMTRNSYELVVIDEAEQVFRHLFSDTITERGTRNRIYLTLREIILRARYVVALDADLDFLTHNSLARIVSERGVDGGWRLQKPIRIWINETPSGDRKTLELYTNKNHLIAEILQAIADQKKVFVTSNSKALIEKIAAVIRDRFGRTRRVIIVTADTGSRAEVQSLVADPAARAAEYDVIMCSPSMGTGVDITFPDNSTLIDVVFGFCEPGISTHLDFDQQLARVRHPGTIKIWITPRRFNYETHRDVVRFDILRAGLYKDLLDGYGDDGRPRFIEDDPVIEMAAIAKAAERASMNDLKQNYLRYKQSQGCTILHVGKDLDRAVAGFGALKRGAELAVDDRVAEICSASVLTRPEYERLIKAAEAGDVLDDERRWSAERTRLELFYRTEATPDLVRLDQGGRRRREIRLFQKVINLPPEAVPLDPNEPLHRNLSFVAVEQLDFATTLVRLLKLTPVWRSSLDDPRPGDVLESTNGRLVPSPEAKKLARHGRVAGSFDAAAVFDARDLKALARFMLNNKGPLENVLGHEVRADIVKKPTQQLGLLLRILGLGLEKAGTQKVAGRKIRRYRLDPSALSAAVEIAARRERKGGWAFLCDHCGPHMDPSDVDDSSGYDESIERALNFVRGQLGTSQDEEKK
jgi:hypothetical protein